MKRENGFYWVKSCNEWTIGKFDDGGWYLPGCDSSLYDNELDFIDENKIINEHSDEA